MPKIVILGGLFGGLTAAFELKWLFGEKADINLLSDMDKFVFIPTLLWLAMGWRKADDINIGYSLLKTKDKRY